ncbi:MAG: signal peptidase I [Acidobacteriota bacterium]
MERIDHNFPSDEAISLTKNAENVIQPTADVTPLEAVQPKAQIYEITALPTQREDTLPGASLSQDNRPQQPPEEIPTVAQPPVSADPLSIPLPAPAPTVISPARRLVMPQLYLKTNNLPRPGGLLPSDDLQIEVLVPEKEPSRVRVWFSEARSLARDFLFAAVTALLIVVFVVQPVKVEGTSMLPRLHDGERIFVNKFIYQLEPIQRGDIVVFWYPKNPNQSFIKRVIGLPNDEVRITNGKLYINNKLVPEPYLSPEFTSIMAHSNHYWTVEDHHYFVMGDNRDASNDSRAWGLVPEKYIYGKAMFRYWPLERLGPLGENYRFPEQSEQSEQ